MTLHEIFVNTAKKYGEKLAINDRMTNKQVTYSRALIASLLLAEEFKKYEKGFVGVMIPTSAGCVLSILGVLMSGRIPVMINYSTGAAKNCEYAQKKCAFKTIITSKALLKKIDCRFVEGMVFIEDIMESLSKLKKINAALTSKLPASVIMNMIHRGKAEDTAVILFTSGSEKDPKAVQLSHLNIIANIESISEKLEFNHKDVFFAQLPFFHVFGLTACLWAPLYHGMTIITYANPIEYRTICELIREERPSLLAGTPIFFWGYLRKSEPGDFASIRLMLSGADKCPDALREGYLKKHNMTLYEAYGVTETSPGITTNYRGANRPGSTGQAFPGVQIRIEHHETGDECPPGEIGKILVKGDNVMKGYFDDFEETSLAMRHGWYDTGDMGYLDDDGYLWHVGRLKRFVKIGGEMVSLVAVENELEKHLDEDVQCCVVELPDPLKGAKIIAAVTAEIDEAAVMKKMAKNLPQLALPKKFQVLEELPKMGSGKIDFRGVTEIVREMNSFLKD